MSKSYDAKAPKVTVMLDKERELVYNFNSFIALQEAFEAQGEEADLEEILKKAEKGKLKTIRTLLWAGLIDRNPDLTEEQVGRLLSPYNLQEVADKLTLAMNKSMPPAEKEATNAPNQETSPATP